MGQYIVRRLLASIPTLLIVSIFIAGLIRLQPGDVLLARISEGGYYSPEQLQQFREELGIDRPFPVQYADWLFGVLRGDFGHSLETNADVLETLGLRSRVTIQLAVMAMAVAVAIGLPMGILSAVKQDTPIDYAARFFAIFGLSVPDYFLATLLIYTLSVYLGWLPQFGYFSIWEQPWENFQAMIFPALIVGYRLAAISARMTRSAMLEVLRQDYVRTARAKGLTERAVVFRHSLRNALIPVITIIGSQFSFLLGGIIIIEIVFSLPGIGALGFHAIQMRDYPVVQGVVLVGAVILILGNLVVDLSYALIDPRIRYS